MRAAAEEPMRGAIEKRESAEHNENEGGFVCGEEEQHGVAVPDGENSLDGVMQTARQEERQEERSQRNLKYAGRENEHFEWKRRRENSGNEDAEEGVAIDPLLRLQSRLATVAMKICLAAFFREEVEPDASGQRPDCGHRRVVRHAGGPSGPKG